MIKVKNLIALFERMLREKWRYEWGAAKEGVVDCSGAFVWAMRQLGGSCYHGSNTMARQDVGELRPAGEARPGWAVFKVRPWADEEKGNRWYNTEPGDIYHVGLMGQNGKVLNAQSTRTGFVASSLDGWDYAAPLSDVDYSEEGHGMIVAEVPAKAMYQAIVETERDPLRVREWPETGTILGKIKRGATVEVLADAEDGWPKIRYNELIGYVSGAYLRRIPEDTKEIPVNDEAVVQLVITDSEGNVFKPVGECTMDVEIIVNG